MKLVFTAEEVAAALQHSLEEFQEMRPALEALGFPKPVRGLEDRWPIISVMNWVNTSPLEASGSGFGEGGTPPPVLPRR
ncbi:MAG: hypothetical protein U1E15_02885 [Hyphomicrobiales bacterium]